MGRSAAQTYLSQALFELGPGIPTKLNQYLHKDMSAEEAITLQKEVIPVDDAYHLITQECPALAQVLEPNHLKPSFHRASLGQVHYGRLRDGREVAIKLQYPELNLHLNYFLDAADKLLSQAFGLNSYQKNRIASHLEYLKKALALELDYLHEAKNQTLMAKIIEDHKLLSGHIQIPLVYCDLSSPTVLVQEWCPPQSWNVNCMSALAHSQGFDPLQLRQDLSKLLFELWTHMALGHGKIHGDIHPGNLSWALQPAKNTPKIGVLTLYDFGQVLFIPEKAVLCFQKTLFCLRQKVAFDPIDTFSELGFDTSELKHFSSKLHDLLRILFYPFLTEKVFDPKNWQFKDQTQKLLGAEHSTFRFAGPPWFLLLMRTMAGTQKLWTLLDTPFQTSNALGRTLGHDEAVPLKQISQEQFTRHSEASSVNSLSPTSSAKSNNLAKSLRVEVRELGEVQVALELPARALEDLESLMPEKLSAKLLSLGIDILKIKAKALNGPLTAQTLFKAQIENKSYHVWLDDA